MTHIQRCPWCLSDRMYMNYHDTQWGKVVTDDDALFACLCLESMQSGLSWMIILKKRDDLYQAFDGFNPNKIADYDDDKINELMNNKDIIRHKAKIQAIIHNAKIYLYQIINQYDSFPKDNQPINVADIPTKTDVSLALSKQLKRTDLNL